MHLSGSFVGARALQAFKRDVIRSMTHAVACVFMRLCIAECERGASTSRGVGKAHVWKTEPSPENIVCRKSVPPARLPQRRDIFEYYTDDGDTTIAVTLAARAWYRSTRRNDFGDSGLSLVLSKTG